MQIYTNGRYKSIEHRAVVHQEKERISIAAFHIPKFGELIGPLPELVSDGKGLYQTLTLEDFLKTSFSAKLDGKSLLDRLKFNIWVQAWLVHKKEGSIWGLSEVAETENVLDL